MTNGSALCVGVSKYNDRSLAALPDAAATAREVQKAMDTRVLPATAVIVDPGSNGDLFLRIQKAAGEARGGTFFFYFAGHALRRGGDLLLATRDTEVDGTRGCVPWSDVRGMLKREGVVGGVVLLNCDQPAGSGKAQLDGGPVAVLGSLRNYDPASGNASIRSYADVVLAALQRPAADLEAFLNDGVLDTAGLHKYLAKHAPANAPHASFSVPPVAAVLRDFSPPAPLSLRGSQLPPAPASSPRPVAAPEPAKESPPPAPAAPVAAVEAAPPPPPPPPPPAPEPEVVSAPAALPVAEAAPPEPAPPSEPVPEPVVASEPKPVPAPRSAPAPAPLAMTPAKPSSTLTYVLLAAAAVIAAAVLYAMLR